MKQLINSTFAKTEEVPLLFFYHDLSLCPGNQPCMTTWFADTAINCAVYNLKKKAKWNDIFIRCMNNSWLIGVLCHFGDALIKKKSITHGITIDVYSSVLNTTYPGIICSFQRFIWLSCLKRCCNQSQSDFITPKVTLVQRFQVD